VVLALAEAHWAGLQAAKEGGEDVAAGLISALAPRGISLSPRQAEVALLILRGHSSTSIALRLGVAVQTVKVFRRQLYARCGITSQAELFALMLPMLRPV
jgi:DNA-binding CsgD family transcriptional regulator